VCKENVSFLFPSNTITLEAALRDLASGSPKARAAAAAALGDVTDPAEKRRAVDALVRALDDDRPEVRMEACAALGELGEPGPLPLIVKRLDDSTPAVRQNAAIALGSLGHADGFDPLATALRDGPPDLRYQAATSLVEIDPARAFEPVLAALADRDAQVAGAAALSLGAIGKVDATLRERATAALAGLVEKHTDAGARFEIAYALAELGDPAGRPILEEALDDAERAWDAVGALAELGAKRELALALGNKTPPEARVLAAGRLLALGDDGEPARAVLLDALDSRKVHMRALAVEQLGDAGGAWAKPPLEKLARAARAGDDLEAIAAALRRVTERSP
jgi:HEAT repeat protein